MIFFLKGQHTPMGTNPSRISDGIIFITGNIDSASVQVPHYGVPATNDIFMEKTDGEGSILAFHCSCWIPVLSIGRI